MTSAEAPLPGTPAVPSDTVRLSSGSELPLLGFGTWRLKDSGATDAVIRALEVGYRHVDTATIYGNEREVGAALRDSTVPREQVFVTSKVPPDRADRARATLEESLGLLGLDALDLWLIHWPPSTGSVDLWREVLTAKDAGLVRDVGVSNYSLAQLDELSASTGTMPSVNQIKWSPYLFDSALLKGHRERGVAVEGYSGLKGGTLEEPVVKRVAERLGCSPAQVLLRWQLDHGVVAIPKSTDPHRIASNADLNGCVLTPEDRADLDGLSRV